MAGDLEVRVPSSKTDRIATVLAAAIAVLSLGVLLRSHITIFGSWWINISSMKFLTLGIFYVFGISILIFIYNRKIVIISLIALISLSMFSAKEDSHELRSGAIYLNNGNEFIYKNNFLLEEKSEIRDIKSESQDVIAMWAAICFKYESFCNDPNISEFAKIEMALFVVSSLLDLGNSRERRKVGAGCIGNSEETPKFEVLNFALVREATIGCCDDFAYLTASFLNYLGIENEYVLMPGHIANRARVGGVWIFVDSMNALIVEGLFIRRGAPKRFHIYPHSNVDLTSRRFDVLNSQRQEISYFADEVHFIMNFMKFRSSGNVDMDAFR
jgi:hypothetical protein